MTRDEVNAYCKTLPGSVLEHPFGDGHDVWKVGGKMYALMGSMNAGMTLKCADPETAALLIEVGRAEKAPYLTRGGWVLIRWGGMEADEMRERIRTSYATVRSGLTKKAQAALGPVPA